MSVYPPADTLAIKAGNVDMTGNANVSSNLTVSGNVGIGVASPGAELHVAGTGAIIVPSGTTVQRPTTGVLGMIRYNTEDTALEMYSGTAWTTVDAPPPLYDFTSHTFTSAGVVGRLGPTLTQLQDPSTGYGTSGTTEWVGNPNYFSVSGGIQKWTVPIGGTYEFVLGGSRGGERGGSVAYPDGLGASVSGRITLTKNDVIKILVGQIPDPFIASSGPAGGGGTFVTTDANVALFVAGGAGGDVTTTTNNYGTASNRGANFVATGRTASNGAGPGGSFSADDSANGVKAGKSFMNGGLGGDGDVDGGFGGGGGSNNANSYPAGGGGYSGGDEITEAGGVFTSTTIGGGGSYVISTATSTETLTGGNSPAWAGNRGYVKITKIP